LKHVRRQGIDTAEHELLLTQLEEIQAVHLAERNRLMDELGDSSEQESGAGESRHH
jgi:hypothetical protein